MNVLKRTIRRRAKRKYKNKLMDARIVLRNNMFNVGFMMISETQRKYAKRIVGNMWWAEYVTTDTQIGSFWVIGIIPHKQASR